ncbi:1,2-dihydroxy-3-keto-5-methylthiopentene dioxygenase [Acidiferrobacter thiooxydans]|jgi:1,2-dihydroxy-3-keto-5-methylthiopentene dioxygenase|uniref:Acireductone dioxygenase n=1 Tax=Acidiferrobacter thiooxydans TaxID=163359 RepID=A0A368HFW5_9GAMM|nr:cupin domain-containing protein [Acidiferrobacter thiooxydans]MDA8191948.1 acireductone dioxygenase [Gammaproteobacteria bacterium]RCN58293.1 acireductone dioxygenase [Acidiferrobacter thiooxydans]
MAELRLQDGSRVTEPARIAAHLAPLGVTLRHWPLPEGALARELLAAQVLTDAQKEQLLGLVEHRFQALQAESGYQARDLIVLHEELAGLREALAKFSAIHYHDDDEVRYVLAGAGYFGFVEQDGTQMLLKVVAGDYINVPARAEHWFVMGDAPRIKAVRYFTDQAGWIPVYTHTPIVLA